MIVAYNIKIQFSAYSQYELNFVPRFLIIRLISFRIFSLWVKFYAYYQNTDNFIQRIIH